MVVRQRSTILRQALILISQPSNALTAIRLIPPVWISHNFKATTLGMTRKTIRNRGFEPWTFRSCLGYQNFVINDNNRDQWKKDSKKTSTATITEIKTEVNVAEKASALVAAIDHGGKFLNTFTPVINSAWIIDSGATDHMTYDSRQVSPLRPSSQKIVSIANGNTTPVIREGSLTLTDTLNLNSVLVVVPSLDYNLLLVSQITAALSCIDIQTRQTIGCGIKRGKLYYLDLQSKDSNKLQQALMEDGSEREKKKSEIWLWHRRLGHASFGYLKKLFPSLFAKSDISGFRCDICELAKSHRASFPLILNKILFPFMTKDEVNLLFKKFHKMIETQYNAKVRVLRSDNGGEYQSSDLQKYLEGHGIIHQTTCFNTPQQNGIAERKNQHLLEGEAITFAAYLINRVPSNLINIQTPLQALTNVVVAPIIPNLPPHGYRCYHPPTRRMYITMDVVFHKDSMYFSSESELQGEYHKEIQTLDYDYHISEEDESGQSELVNQEAGELDMSGQQFGSENVFTEIPNQSSSVEGVLNLEPNPFMKRLPHRHNRGIPKPTYEPKLSTKVKYPMNNLTMSSTFALSTSMSCLEMMCPRIIPCCTMK
uniref:Integrase catalytic domain-containing protein n=1 Tax=Vitis vinifera TaxID=29760 RepID=A5AUY1_VITVI|nr:hypothetical protein VITISV_015841 [Vitis vinifera]